jgi:tetratricopeptide (TPR) repeat protein
MSERADTRLTGPERARIHRLGGSLTDIGTRRLAVGGPGERDAAVRSHRRAIELLGRLPLDEDADYLADLGAAWVNLGFALQGGETRESLAEALDALDRGLDVLGRLPLESNPRFRHNLAAAWMNRADVLVRVDTPSSRLGAIRAYTTAIGIAGGLPLDEKASFRVLLASCWINLGGLYQRLGDGRGAVLAYERSLDSIGDLPRSGHRLARHHAATAWTNRGESLLAAPGLAGRREAVESARRALAEADRGGLEESVAAKLSLRALRVAAVALESLAGAGGSGAARWIGELTDLADRGFAVALAARGRDALFFDPFVVWFFSLGGRVYGRYQPQFLAEFLAEGIRRSGAARADALAADLAAAAREATDAALVRLGRRRLLVAGSPQTELLITTVGELRRAARELNP